MIQSYLYLTLIWIIEFIIEFLEIAIIMKYLKNLMKKRFTREETVNLPDQLFVNEFDSNWDMMNYYFDGDKKSLNRMIFLLLVLNAVTIVLLLILICINRKNKYQLSKK